MKLIGDIGIINKREHVSNRGVGFPLRNVALTVTKKVRKVKEEIVALFPRPVLSSQIPPPPIAWTISGTTVG